MKPLVDTYKQFAACRAGAGEANDCTVISLAAVMNWPYQLAHSHMRNSAGRAVGGGANMEIAANALDAMSEVGGICPEKGICLGDFCKAHPAGRYWVFVTGHALAVVNGQVHDHSLRPRRRVRYAWRIHTEINH